MPERLRWEKYITMSVFETNNKQKRTTVLFLDLISVAYKAGIKEG